MTDTGTQATLNQRERLIETLTHEVERDTRVLCEATKVLHDRAQGDAPWQLAYDFEWSGSTFRRAASLKEGQALLERLERIDEETGEPFPLSKMVEWYTEDVMLAARSPEQSTSPLSNFMDRARLAARAMLLERLITRVATEKREEEEER
jgi:hypothetical protein